ncbi:MAG: DUF3881 family protein [Eubacterium sp.]|nr:DUF3881 family protein [Eubacterium sp.]
MHDYLRSIGFSELKRKIDIEELIRDIIDHPTETLVTEVDENTTFMEYRKQIGDSIGIAVRGEAAEDGKFTMSYYYPYFDGHGITSQDYIEIEKHADQSSYAGICDEIRLGVTMVFYLQNVAEYYQFLEKTQGMKGIKSVTLSALAKSGSVVLPIAKSENDIIKERQTNTNRTSLIAAARDGDEDAIENLTLEDIDTYTRISRRIMYEDILTIVESSFMPYGIDSDNYYVLGEILAVKKVENAISGESVFEMTICCNDMEFDICINEKDLLGEPLPGRRFRGAVWMQGKIHF